MLGGEGSVSRRITPRGSESRKRGLSGSSSRLGTGLMLDTEVSRSYALIYTLPQYCSMNTTYCQVLVHTIHNLWPLYITWLPIVLTFMTCGHHSVYPPKRRVPGCSPPLISFDVILGNALIGSSPSSPVKFGKKHYIMCYDHASYLKKESQ